MAIALDDGAEIGYLLLGVHCKDSSGDRFRVRSGSRTHRSEDFGHQPPSKDQLHLVVVGLIPPDVDVRKDSRDAPNGVFDELPFVGPEGKRDSAVGARPFGSVVPEELCEGSSNRDMARNPVVRTWEMQAEVCETTAERLVEREVHATRCGVRAKLRPNRRRPEQLGHIDGLLLLRARQAGGCDHELPNAELGHRSWDEAVVVEYHEAVGASNLRRPSVSRSDFE